MNVPSSCLNYNFQNNRLVYECTSTLSFFFDLWLLLNGSANFQLLLLLYRILHLSSCKSFPPTDEHNRSCVSQSVLFVESNFKIRMGYEGFKKVTNMGGFLPLSPREILRLKLNLYTTTII